MPRTAKPAASLLPAVTEREVVAACLSYLKLRGWLAWRNNVGAMDGEYKGKKWFVRFGEPGVSDIIGLAPTGSAHAGKLLALECKGPKGRLRPEQEAFLSNVTASGGIALVVRGVHELAAAIDRLG